MLLIVTTFGLSGSDGVDGVEEIVGVEWLGSHWFRDGFWVDVWHYETLELPSLVSKLKLLWSRPASVCNVSD